MFINNDYLSDHKNSLFDGRLGCVKDSGKRKFLAGAVERPPQWTTWTTLLDPTSVEIALEIKIEIKSTTVERPP